MTTAEDDRPAPGVRDLFLGFLIVGISGFGGVLPWVRRMVVEQRRWLSPAEFIDLLGLCQFLPGPNVINMSVALGARFHGWRGAVAAFSGVTLPPIAIVLGLAALYDRFGDQPLVTRALAGMAAAAAGLVLATALKIAAPLRGHWRGLGIAGLGLVAVGLLQWPLLPVLLVLVPASVALHWNAA